MTRSPSFSSTLNLRRHILTPFLSRWLHIRNKMKLSSATVLLLCLFLVSSSLLEVTMASSAFCDGKCGERCAKAGVQDRCMKFCGICCEKCKCVPSGTYGNKHECPCYRDLKNSKGKPKCP